MDGPELPIGLAVLGSTITFLGFLLASLVFFLDRFVKAGNVVIGKKEGIGVFGSFVIILIYGIVNALLVVILGSDGFSTREMNIHIWLFGIWLCLASVMAIYIVGRSTLSNL